MSTPEHAPTPATNGSSSSSAGLTTTPGHDSASIVALVKDVEMRLRGWHIARPDRLSITGGLRADLLAAQADGRNPRQLLGDDVDDFVQRLVTEGGYATTTYNPVRLAVLGTLLAIPAIIVAYVLTFAVIVPLFSAFISPHLNLPRAGTTGGWVGVGVMGSLTVLAVLGGVLRGKPAARQTLRAAVLTVVAAAVAAVVGNLVILQATSRITTGSVTLQVLMVLLPLAGAVALARWWGLRRAAG